MSSKKRTANTAPYGTPDGAPAAPKPQASPDAVRCRVRLKAGGPEKRFRAGLAFVRQHVELEVPPPVLDALKADAWLEVEVLA